MRILLIYAHPVEGSFCSADESRARFIRKVERAFSAW